MSRIETHVLPRPGSRERLAQPIRAVVAGGGLAGLAAATILAERGASVTILERERFLGGRAGSWDDTLVDGRSFEMERGFHAFFRQYYNLRALLRRIDPELSMLHPLEDYPLLGPDGRSESFAGLPRTSPWNVVALTRRTKTIGWRDLVRIDRGAAMEMLRYDPETTYERFDDRTARDYLDSLSFPAEARRMLFDVFAHSFFNPEDAMSAAELLMMFHFYFIGNPEGLVFDVTKEPFGPSIFDPLRKYLEGLGVVFRTETAVERIARGDGATWRVSTAAAGDAASRPTEAEANLDADAVVLALPVAPLRHVIEASPDLADDAWRERVASLALTNPFAVWRMWLDRPVREDRSPFAGTTGVGMLDNISVYEKLEGESAAWARERGASIVELHAYSVPLDATEAEIRDDLRAAMQTFYPETAEATVLEERFLLRRDCPAFAPGSHAKRPGVETPFDGIALAGDFARLPFPSALMERATSSGMLAANTLLAPYDVAPEPLESVRRRGWLARRRKRSRAASASEPAVAGAGR